MIQYKINSLIKKIKKSSLEASSFNNNFTYFYDTNFEKPIKIYLSSSATKWLHDYKSKEQLEKFLKFKNQNSIFINTDVFFIIYYCYLYIIPDLIYLKKITSEAALNSLNTLNIGAGLALHDIFLSKLTNNIKSFNIIEKKSLINTDEINPTVTNEKIVNVFDLSKQNVVDNKIKNFSFFNEKSFLNINKKFDLIYSFRSWCYKYEVKTYLDFVLESLNDNGIVLIDIRNSFDNDKLINNFKNYRVLAEYKSHKRYIFKK